MASEYFKKPTNKYRVQLRFLTPLLLPDIFVSLISIVAVVFVLTTYVAPQVALASSNFKITANTVNHDITSTDDNKIVSFLFPRYWLTAERSGHSLEGEPLTEIFFSDQADRGSYKVKLVDLTFSTPTGIFGLSKAVLSVLNHDDIANYYIDKLFKSYEDFKVINTSFQKVATGFDQYEIELTYISSKQLRFREIDRILFKGQSVFLLRGAYLDSQSSWRSSILRIMDSFEF